MECAAAITASNGRRYLECSHCAFTWAPDATARHEQPWADGFRTGTVPPHDERKEDGPGFLDVALERLQDLAPLDILDFGTGQSGTPAWLRAMGHQTIAIDLVPPDATHPDRLVGDLFDAAFPSASFDISYADHVFEHLGDPRPYLEELLRVTKPGGLVLIRSRLGPGPVQDPAQPWRRFPVRPVSFYGHATFERALAGTSHGVFHRDDDRLIIERG